jgi:hypothetical protein
MMHGWYMKFENDRETAQSLIDDHGTWFQTNYPMQYGWATDFLTSIAEILGQVKSFLDDEIGCLTLIDLQAQVDISPSIKVSTVLANLPDPLDWRVPTKAAVGQANRTALASYIRARIE